MERLTNKEAVSLLKNGDILTLGQQADKVRRQMHPGNIVTFIIDRNINYTNICVNECNFCAFYRRPSEKGAYLLSIEDILKKTEETVAASGTQIMLQGGLHPDVDFQYYIDMLTAIKKRFDILQKDSKFALIDDYGHHPTEIEATLKSAKLYAKLMGYDKITVVWQPHKWSRTMDNLEHFVECFEGVDTLVILPVWAVNEEPRGLDFAEVFGRYNPILASRVKKMENGITFVTEKGDIHEDTGVVIGFGAGDITYQLRGQK